MRPSPCRRRSGPGRRGPPGGRSVPLPNAGVQAGQSARHSSWVPPGGRSIGDHRGRGGRPAVRAPTLLRQQDRRAAARRQLPGRLLPGRGHHDGLGRRRRHRRRGRGRHGSGHGCGRRGRARGSRAGGEHRDEDRGRDEADDAPDASGTAPVRSRLRRAWPSPRSPLPSPPDPLVISTGDSHIVVAETRRAVAAGRRPGRQPSASRPVRRRPLPASGSAHAGCQVGDTRGEVRSAGAPRGPRPPGATRPGAGGRPRRTHPAPGHRRAPRRR